MEPKSLILCIANFVVAAVLFLAFDAGVESRPLELLLMPFCFYFTLSFAVAIYGIAVGIVGIYRKSLVKLNIVGALGNSAYLVIFIVGVKSIWPALMGI